MESKSRMYLGEFFATFIFIFAVCATTLNTPILNIPTIGPIAAGFAAFCVVFCFGGHFNTAVTIGAMVGKKMDTKTGLIYIALQLVASFLAVGLINVLFPGSTNSDSLMVKPPDSSSMTAAVFMEFFLTFILVLVIFRSAMGVQVKPKIESKPAAEAEAEVADKTKENTEATTVDATAEIGDTANVSADTAAATVPIDSAATDTAANANPEDSTVIQIEDSSNSNTTLLENPKEFQSRLKASETRKNHAPLVIGLTIAFLATMGGTVSGGAFNPLRPTAPAFFTLNFNYLWIYWLGDCLGGLTAGLVHYHLFED